MPMRGMDVGSPQEKGLPTERMKPDATFAAPPRRFAMSRCKGRWQNLADFRRLRNGLDRRDGCTPALVTPRNHMLLYLLCRWFHHRWRTQCVGKSITNSSLSRRKAQDARIKQEKRAGVIDGLLNQANEQGEKVEVEAAPPKEVAPAK
jgi:hypothetical protein